MNYLHLFIMVLCTFLITSLFTGCAVTGNDQYAKSSKDGVRLNEKQVRFDGTIVRDKKGAYLIKSNSGSLYRPNNLSSSYQQKGLNVVVFGKTDGAVRKGGQPLEIYEIGIRK